MKKIVALLLLAAMSAMVFACGGVSAGGSTASTSGSSLSSKVTSAQTPTAKLAVPYADIDFTENSVADSKGKLLLEIKTNGTVQAASVETVSVDFCGYNKTLPALRIKNTGTWIKAVFSDIKSAAELDAFVEESGGFTVEAFYMDNSSTGANRAIVCCTESIGGDARRSGWGIAENTEGKPYFITGHTSENAYSSVYANAAPAEEAIHVVAVYNAETRRNAIYINGELVSSDSAAGKFTAADKTEVYEGFNMGNVFYIGADPSASAGRKEHCDFPSSDLTVIDVKLYGKALTSGEVKAAYNSALELFL